MKSRTKPLSMDELRTLTRCEQTIKDGISQWRAVGMALERIKAEKLYRIDFKTWESYCKGRWNISIRVADRKIAASKIAKAVDPEGKKLRSQRAANKVETAARNRVRAPDSTPAQVRAALDAMPLEELVAVQAQSEAEHTADDGFAEKWIKWIAKGRKLISGRPEVAAVTTHLNALEEFACSKGLCYGTSVFWGVP